MSKKDVINYVMETPGNTNPAVLETLLDGLEAQDNRFIVTFTPTAADYSGTMDKTIAEIHEAYQAGKRLVAKVVFEEYDMDGYIDLSISYQDGFTYPSVSVTIPNPIDDTLIIFATYTTNDESLDSYNAFIYPLNKKFVVTLTPTAADYSGTMDYTVGEIYDAYVAGKEIWFDVGGGQAVVPLSIVSGANGYDYPSFEVYLINPGIGSGAIMYAYTQYTNDSEKQTYATQIYALTPAT